MTIKATPIILTKLTIPPLREAIVSRKRLLKQLNGGLERKLTLVSAPAGYGKSTLIREWVEQVKVPVAWLSFDSGDNDPARFWSYFVAALHTIPGLKHAWAGDERLNFLQTPPLPDNESLLADLISTITSIPKRFILILEDLQAITEATVLESLFFLIENLQIGSKGMHLVIASRIDPPWPLARLRVSNEITEVRTKDLRFTVYETAEFINGVMGFVLLPKEIAELEQRTEGWIAGLQMAAISMQGQEDVTGFLEAFSGSHRFVLDYLVEEVLNSQTPEILVFLLKTSILDRMTGSLCDAVTENRGGVDLLPQLEKTNLFLMALDEQRTWYRYHHLFADLLQKQLRAGYLGQIPNLHRLASQWYAQNGFPTDAVEHALKSEDWDFATSQVEKHIIDLIQRGEMILARRWLNSLPDEAIQPRPVLCIAQVWTSTQYTTVQLAEDLLVQAEATIVNGSPEGESFDPQLFEILSSQIAVLQVMIARMRGDSTHRQQELALEALDHLVPPHDTAARSTLFLRLGLSYLDLGKDKQADRAFSQAFELGKFSGNYYAAQAANYGRMVIARRHGNLNAITDFCQQSLSFNIEKEKQQHSLNGIALIIAGSLSYEQNNLDIAEQLLVQGLEMAEGAGIPEILIKGHFSLACLQIARGNKVYLLDLKKLAQNSQPGVLYYAAALQVRLYQLLTQLGEDSQFEKKITIWAETQRLNFRGQPTYDWEIFEKLVYARVLCRQIQTHPSEILSTRLEEVLDFIEGQRQPLEELNWRGTLIEVYIVISLILYSLGRKTEALNAVEQALNLGETLGYLRTFVDEGKSMRELLQLALAEGIHKTYTQILLSAFDNQRTPTSPKTSLQPDELSERELQVLRLLNTQLSVPEIATEIHLAPTTIRTHVQHIYQKLGVHGRIEALQKAKEIGLL